VKQSRYFLVVAGKVTFHAPYTVRAAVARFSLCRPPGLNFRVRRAAQSRSAVVCAACVRVCAWRRYVANRHFHVARLITLCPSVTMEPF